MIWPGVFCDIFVAVLNEFAREQRHNIMPDLWSVPNYSDQVNYYVTFSAYLNSDRVAIVFSRSTTTTTETTSSSSHSNPIDIPTYEIIGVPVVLIAIAGGSFTLIRVRRFH